MVRTEEGLELRLEEHRRELTAYTYRMLGSAFEAEDAVQETMLRAWRSYEGFEGRSALRSWLYRIATNVCLDMLSGRERRARPMDMAEPRTADAQLGPPLPEATWILPIPDARVVPADFEGHDLCATDPWVFAPDITARLNFRWAGPDYAESIVQRAVVRCTPPCGPTVPFETSFDATVGTLVLTGNLEPNGTPHPNRNGQRALADAFVAAIRERP